MSEIDVKVPVILPKVGDSVMSSICKVFGEPVTEVNAYVILVVNGKEPAPTGQSPESMGN